MSASTLHHGASRHPHLGCRHLLKLALILEVLHIVVIEASLLDVRLAIKETLGEGMVLTLDPLSFLFAHREIQTGRLEDAALRSRSLLAYC